MRGALGVAAGHTRKASRQLLAIPRARAVADTAALSTRLRTGDQCRAHGPLHRGGGAATAAAEPEGGAPRSPGATPAQSEASHALRRRHGLNRGSYCQGMSGAL